MEPVNGIIYCRVSQLEPKPYSSLIFQEAVCQELCTAKDIDVIKIYSEVGEADNPKERSVTKRMLSFLKRHRRNVPYLIAERPNILAGTSIEHAELRRILNNWNIHVLYALDPGSFSEDQLMLGVQTVLSNKDRVRNSKRLLKPNAYLKNGNEAHQCDIPASVSDKSSFPFCMEPRFIMAKSLPAQQALICFKDEIQRKKADSVYRQYNFDDFVKIE